MSLTKPPEALRSYSRAQRWQRRAEARRVAALQGNAEQRALLAAQASDESPEPQEPRQLAAEPVPRDLQLKDLVH